MTRGTRKTRPDASLKKFQTHSLLLKSPKDQLFLWLFHVINGYFYGYKSKWLFQWGSYFVQQSKGSEWPCQEAKILCRSHRQKTKNMTKPGGPNGVTAAGAASAPLPVNRLLPPQRCLKPCSILSCLLAALQYHPPHDKSTHSGVSFRISSTSRLSAIVCVTCRKNQPRKTTVYFYSGGNYSTSFLL